MTMHTWSETRALPAHAAGWTVKAALPVIFIGAQRRAAQGGWRWRGGTAN